MATGAYDSNGIWKYGEDDNISLFSTTLNKLADSTSSALTSDRARLATLEGGSLAGLIPVVPTTITAVTGTAAVNTLGVVSFTGVTAINLDGCFTALYKNYRVVVNTGVSTSTDTALRFRTSGVTQTPTYYRTAVRGAVNGAVNGQGSTTDNLLYLVACTNTNSGANSIMLDVLAPAATVATNILFEGYGSQLYFFTGAGLVDNSLSYDGFSFYPLTGTMTGTIQVFGYND